MDEVQSEDVGGDSVGLGFCLEKFEEWKEVLEIVENVGKLEDRGQSEKAYERLKYVVNQYKEQPHLLDGHLATLIDAIVKTIKSDTAEIVVKHRVFQYMFLITNVRGYKVVVQHLPHAAADLEPALVMLEEQDIKDTSTWETRYCLLLWLSIIVKIPFHMSRLDGSGVESGDYKPIMQRIYDICQKYLMAVDASRDAAAFLCAHFLTRSDIKEIYLKNFFEWSFSWINQKDNWARLGPLTAVAVLLKYGKRDDLLPHAPWLLERMLLVKWKEEPYRLCRKFAVKIIQRIGLTFLKARVITWRYNRGQRLLEPMVTALSKGEKPTHLKVQEVEGKAGEEAEEDDDDEDVPEELEEIIEELMQGLRDPDITVRWSAAKGIGRVMGRISKQLGDDVIGCVLELLSPRESDSAWHGGCLALAELGKRGLLLPSRLPEVVPLIKKALVYDEPRGYISVGSHIRDAACYVCWSFARAYDSHVFKPFVQDIASALVVVNCFDREINIRRAASAAFQEHIGRQGTFPHGIDILTAADFFSVGVRSNAYLNVSVYIAQFEEYRSALIDHLVERKIEHWDSAIRELAAKALHNLTPLAPNYMVEVVLPSLLQKYQSIDVNVRHGSIMAIGEIMHALSLLEEKVTPGEEIISAIRDLVSVVRAKNQFRGLSGELMKLACCHLIHKCSLAKAPFYSLPVLDDWQMLIDDCLCHEVSNIRLKAADALAPLCSEYYQKDGVADQEKCFSIVKRYTEKIGSNDEITRLGYSLALGSLPLITINGFVDIIITSLINCATKTPSTERWVDSRRTAIKGLTSICTTVGIHDSDEKSSCRPHVPAILNCFVEGLKDYTKDDRGDTGAWVRESCMSGLQKLVLQAAEHAPELLTEEMVKNIMCGVVQQAVERIDRTRALAGTVFSSLLHNSPQIPYIPEREAVIEIFSEDACKLEINWLSNDTFPRFAQMLSLRTYTYSLMAGLISSVGGLTESLVKSSSSSLFSYLKSQELDELKHICDIIINIFELNLKVDRIVLPMLSFLELLFSSGTIRPVLEDPTSNFAIKIFNMTRTLQTGCSEKYKLLGSVDVYCQLIQVRGEVCKKALGRIMILLCHKFAWVRKATAGKFYEALMLYGEETECPEESLDTVLTILSETEWSTQPMLEDVRNERNKISLLFNIPPPVPVVKS